MKPLEKAAILMKARRALINQIVNEHETENIDIAIDSIEKVIAELTIEDQNKRLNI